MAILMQKTATPSRNFVSTINPFRKIKDGERPGKLLEKTEKLVAKAERYLKKAAKSKAPDDRSYYGSLQEAIECKTTTLYYSFFYGVESGQQLYFNRFLKKMDRIDSNYRLLGDLDGLAGTYEKFVNRDSHLVYCSYVDLTLFARLEKVYGALKDDEKMAGFYLKFENKNVNEWLHLECLTKLAELYEKMGGEENMRKSADMRLKISGWEKTHPTFTVMVNSIPRIKSDIEAAYYI